MAISVPTTYKDMLALITDSAKRVYWSWEVEFIADGKVLKAERLIDFDEFSDYENKHSAETTIVVGLVLSDYQRFIYPNRKNLTALIRKKPLMETRNVERDESYELRYYRVVPSENTDIQTIMSMDSDPSLGFAQFTFQLEEEAITLLRNRTTGTIARDERAADVLRALLGIESMALKLPMDQRVKGVTMVEPNVKDPLPHVIVEHGTPVLDLAGYMQLKCGGIYNSMMGSFLIDNMWYLYPIYDTEQYNQSERVMDLLILPANRTLGLDRTHMLVGNRLIIAITGQTNQSDSSDIDYIKLGNGVRFMNATQLFDGFTEVKDNIAVADVNRNSSHIAIDERDSGNQNAPFSQNKITDNVAVEISKLSPRKGQIVNLMWNYSNHNLLKPGMPLKLHYPVPGGTEERLGVLLSAETHASTTERTMSSVRYVSNTNLRIFIQK